MKRQVYRSFSNYKRVSQLLPFISIVFIIILPRCTSTKHIKQTNQIVYYKTEFIRFWIEKVNKPEKDIWIGINYKNISDETIWIQDPESAVKPNLIDSLGNFIGESLEIYPGRLGDKIIIEAGEVYKFDFYFSINNYFAMEKEKSYELRFIYYGNIFNENNELIDSGDPLASNTLKIIFD
jgi:hypothetical protein